MIDFIMIYILWKWKIVNHNGMKLLYKRSWLSFAENFNTYHIYDKPKIYTFEKTHRGDLDKITRYLSICESKGITL